MYTFSNFHIIINTLLFKYILEFLIPSVTLDWQLLTSEEL